MAVYALGHGAGLFGEQLQCTVEILHIVEDQ